ncbi:MAG: DUF479 domain-containing protein [Deltaproteobacteria bacterium]|nr:DUF479 domain-containing protein [Deltaproteobacteria bacterium]
MGDFVKGPIPADLPDELSRHLRLHRRLDSYTQQSRAFQRSRRRLDPRFRYARSILVDVFYDHFLARHWRQYSSRPLTAFAQDVYRGLQSNYALLPAALQQQLPHMIEHDWLTSYQHTDVVSKVLRRLEMRLQHKFPLAQGIAELERCQASLENDFAAFMLEVTDVIGHRYEHAQVDQAGAAEKNFE